MNRDVRDGQVWILRYVNSEATHIEVFECEDAAWVGAGMLVLDNLNEVDDEEKENLILEDLERDYMRSAVTLYSDAMDETFEIIQRPLLNPTVGELEKKAEEFRQLFDEARNEPQAP